MNGWWRWGKRIFWVAVVITIILFGAILLTRPTGAATSNISPTNRYAWGDLAGWWDFYHYNGTGSAAGVTSFKLIGSASSSLGDISLDCKTSPTGDICASSEYGICNGPGPHSGGACPNGDASGILTGYAWNDNLGWISFCGNDSLCSDYGVTIDASGDFHGWAWNDVTGWISFNCDGTGGPECANPYLVSTSWSPGAVASGTIESAVFDTQLADGAKLNNIVWRGSKPGNSCVKFQIAVANSETGPWTYFGANSPVAATSTGGYYGESCVGAGTPIEVNYNLGSFRYLRYKAFLLTNTGSTASPEVTDVILNWSK